ncbi:hypothetical protein ABB02_01253 [Clostridiaceae bacterium JG1575]|nr:hypothetical protein ABB02_01253 [Clostridiaceae bacterium JG1575]
MIYDVLIVGAGPAGLYTALALKEAGVERMLLLDQMDELGGQLNDIIEVDASFGEAGYTGVELADDLRRNIILHGIDYETESYVVSVDRDKVLQVLHPQKGLRRLQAHALVFATGARERPRGILKFTSKRATGVFSVGTARKFIVEEGYLPGKNIVIYGADWTGLYLTRLLITEGAAKVTIVDRAKELKFPNEELEAFFATYGVQLALGKNLVDIQGENRVSGVTLEGNSGNPKDRITLPCDTLLLSVGLLPQRSLFSKRFRRGLERQGAFVTGNAETITFDQGEIRARAEATAQEVTAYLAALAAEGKDSEKPKGECAPNDRQEDA